jgi:lipopolysaccharide transport system ATP-binding protein
MSDVAIRVEGLGKRYRLGERRRYKALRDSLADGVKAPVRAVHARLDGRAAADGAGSGRNVFWALSDVSFEVKPGEVVGVIGRNGAGKSTLLKILSRITEPTTGHAEIHGRVGSLLEVGTGFHPELTGRENIYLNGAILGMHKAEVERKFDEIVAFAEVEKFIDTPVKFYSSGMYLRLGFAVAAHLEPEILLVDEVLAVGDATFQKKCMGKMGEVARQGRTVLFVSHNMAAIVSLCSRALVMEGGTVASDGDTNAGVNRYLRNLGTSASTPLGERADRKGNQRLRFLSFDLLDGATNEPLAQPVAGGALGIALRYRSADGRPLRNVRTNISVHGRYDEKLFQLSTNTSGSDFGTIPADGTLVCRIPNLPLVPGRYAFNVYCTVGGDIADWVQGAGFIEVAPGDFFGSGKLPPLNEGSLLVGHGWHATERAASLSVAELVSP